jgi:hypothetical protein
MIPIVLPNRVRLWNELDNMEIKSENNSEYMENLKTFIVNYIKEITTGE